MSYFTHLREMKELYHLREKSLSNWRQDIQEEHPYVEVMPGGDDDIHPKLKNDIKNKNKRREEQNKTVSL